jgi:hypothetical protein
VLILYRVSHKFAIPLFIILLPVVISSGLAMDISYSSSTDFPHNFTFAFFNNGTLVRMNSTIYGLPDNDGDALNDLWENAAVNELSPWFSLDNNEVFFDHPEDKVLMFSRATPFPSSENPRYILFWYVVTWSRDYGKYGIGTHNGDTEPFIMVWKIVDNQTLTLDSVYIHAHEGCNEREDLWNATGISCNYAGVCDFTFREITGKPLCSSLEFFDNRLLLYVSKDKHALFPSRESCQSSILIEPSPNWDSTNPGGSILNVAGSISTRFWQISFHCYRFLQKTGFFPLNSGASEGYSGIFPNSQAVFPVTEECNTAGGIPLCIHAFNTGEPDQLFITNLTGYGFFGEPITGIECGTRLRFLGGLACDGNGATPVYSWLVTLPEIVKQRLL